MKTPCRWGWFVVCIISSNTAKKSVPQMLEDFKQHRHSFADIARWPAGQYSAHVVPEAGINMLPGALVGDGVLIAGDAAGMCMNLGFTISGINMAIAAGEAATKTVLSAMKSDDFSKQTAQCVSVWRVARCAICACPQKPNCSGRPTRIFARGYPELAVGVARDLTPVAIRRN